MLWLGSAMVPGTQVQKFSSAFLGALLLAVLNLLVDGLIERGFLPYGPRPGSRYSTFHQFTN